MAAARAGAGFGAFLVVLGFASLLTVGAAGLWSVLIGLFLYSAARSEQRYAQVQEAVAGLPVARAMNPRPSVAPARTSVADLVGGYAWSHRGDAVAVTDDQGMLAGVVTAQTVRAVPPGRRRAVTLAEIAVPLDGVPVARPGEPLGALLERMVAREGRPAFVLDADHRLAGIVTLADVERAAAVGQGRWTREAGR